MRRAGLFFVALSLSACQGKARDREERPSEGVETAATPAPGARPRKAALCQVGDEVDEKTRQTLYAHAQRVLNALRGGAALPLWNDVHPDLRKDEGREPFLAALENLQERLAPTTADPERGELILLKVAPGVDERLRIRCPGELQLTAHVQGEDLAFVTLYLQGPVLQEALVVRMRERDGHFYLVGIEGNPVKFNGQDSTAFEEKGDALLESGRTLAGYLMYGMAQTLGSRGTGLRTPDRRRVEGKLERLTRTKAFKDAASGVEVDGKTLELIRIGLSTSPGGIAPNIRYVTTHALKETDKLTREAAALVGRLTQQHPTVLEVFDTALVEAYAERPRDPSRPHDAFQTVISLGDKKRDTDK